MWQWCALYQYNEDIIHRTDYSSKNFASITPCTQNFYWHKTEIIPHVTPAFLLVTSDSSSITITLNIYQRNYFNLRCYIWGIYGGKSFISVKAWLPWPHVTCGSRAPAPPPCCLRFLGGRKSEAVSSCVHPPGSARREHLFLPLQCRQDECISTF